MCCWGHESRQIWCLDHTRNDTDMLLTLGPSQLSIHMMMDIGSMQNGCGRCTRPFLINRTNTRPQSLSSFFFLFFFSKSYSIANPVFVLGSLTLPPLCFRLFTVEPVSTTIILIFVVSNQRYPSTPKLTQ
ncbi:hypothetical protein HZ326_17930 [Fusarium oxysporum f. sp. albedinis]|nr:hypothetical protein HZ326_17930 [Fusarium oxysporum f. sp. albedinis]